MAIMPSVLICLEIMGLEQSYNKMVTVVMLMLTLTIITLKLIINYVNHHDDNIDPDHYHSDIDPDLHHSDIDPDHYHSDIVSDKLILIITAVIMSC